MKAKLIKIKDIKASANEGFTLIELLVVIGILAILMGIVLIAINPPHQFALANDTNRRNAVAQILSAVGQYEAENNGKLPPSIAALPADTDVPISNAAASPADADLCTDLIAGPTQFIPALPADPTNSSSNGQDIGKPCPAGYDTGYTVQHDANNRVTITAGHTQVPPTIKVTR